MSGAAELAWTTGSFCGNGTCVELAFVDATVLIRDSKQVAAATTGYDILAVPRDEFDACIEQLATTGSVVSSSLVIDRCDADTLSFSSQSSEIALSFTNEEFEAFRRAALNGEFDAADHPELDPSPTLG